MGELRSIGIVPKEPAPLPQPDLALIAKLKGLLAEAESGELQALAYAAVYADSSFTDDWEGDTASVMTTLTAVLMLYRHFSADADETMLITSKAPN